MRARLAREPQSRTHHEKNIKLSTDREESIRNCRALRACGVAGIVRLSTNRRLLRVVFFAEETKKWKKTIRSVARVFTSRTGGDVLDVKTVAGVSVRFFERSGSHSLLMSTPVRGGGQ